jgi:hypothetical protein
LLVPESPPVAVILEVLLKLILEEDLSRGDRTTAHLEVIPAEWRVEID